MKSLYVALCVALLTLVGCGGGDVDTEAPVSEVKQEAEGMSVADLQKKAEAYQKQISAKMQDLEPLREKLGEIPMTQQMGDEAKALQEDIAALTQDVEALKERLSVYVDALKEKGAAVQDSL